jgi:hypothetical protein
MRHFAPRWLTRLASRLAKPFLIQEMETAWQFASRTDAHPLEIEPRALRLQRHHLAVPHHMDRRAVLARDFAGTLLGTLERAFDGFCEFQTSFVCHLTFQGPTSMRCTYSPELSNTAQASASRR